MKQNYNFFVLGLEVAIIGNLQRTPTNDGAAVLIIVLWVQLFELKTAQEMGELVAANREGLRH